MSAEPEEISQALRTWLPDIDFESAATVDLFVEYSEYDRANPAIADLPPVSSSPVEWVDSTFISADHWIPVGTEKRTDSVDWSASLYRLDCQSPEFGEPPIRPVHGRCDTPIYVRVVLGTLSGNAPDHESAVQAFASELRKALLNLPEQHAVRE